jgi:hypothetical protein
MWIPQPFFQRSSVLVADRRSFSAAYLAQTLTSTGCQVIGPFDSRDALSDWLSARHEQLSVAIVALDWLDDLTQPILALLQERNVPFVLVDNAPWRHLGGVDASFSWPYAAFQILEALQNAMLQALPVPAPPSA